MRTIRQSSGLSPRWLFSRPSDCSIGLSRRNMPDNNGGFPVMAMAPKFKPEERAAIRAILIAAKRFWNAPADTKDEGRAAEAIIDIVEKLKEFD